MKKGKFSVLLMCLMVLVFFLVSCGGGSKSAFLGKWYLVEGGGRNIPQDFELLKDGTGLALNQAISWKIENNRLYITNPSLAMVFNYIISGSRLDLSNDDGGKFVYRNKLGGASAIVGEWEVIDASVLEYHGFSEDEREEFLKYYGNRLETKLEFNKDGTGNRSGQQMKWITEKDMLLFIGTPPMKYEIKDGILTIEEDFSKKLKFKKI